jgi:molybdopterin synthase sulfur carrier subunit
VSNPGTSAKIRVILPYHLRTLAKLDASAGGEAALDVSVPVTMKAVLDAIEDKYPTLRGTIRDYGTGQRRPFLRFFVCEQDWSHEPVDKALPEAVASGREPLLVIGAIAGG